MIKEKFLAFLKEEKKRLERKWEDRKPEQKLKINNIFNYLANGFLLSFPTYFLMSVWLPHSFSRYIASIISWWIILPFIEHYYSWFRLDWKD